MPKKRTKSPKTPKGEKKPRHAHPKVNSGQSAASSSSQHADCTQKCHLFYEYQANATISEGDAIVVNYMDLKFIVEASEFKEVEGTKQMNLHFNK